MPITIRAVGPFRGASGYDRMTRGFARSLIELGARLQLVPVAGWSPDLPPFRDGDWFGRHTEPVNADIAVHFMMPDRCRPVPGLPNANFTMFEATRIPPAWVERSREHDLVILPNQTCREAWQDSGVPATKLRVCGLGTDGAFFARPTPPLDLVDHRGRPVRGYRRRFLHVGELRPRKNHLGLLRTWLRATTSEDDAVLILKSVAHPHLATLFGQDVAGIQEQIGRRFGDAAPVVFLNEVFDDDQMRALYHTATHYISMSHAEGWDLPMMEAAAAGLSLLVPDQPTYRVYLGPSDADWIRCSQVDVHLEGRAGIEDLSYFRGLRWWQPDEADAAELLARVIASGQSRPPPTRKIVTDFTWLRASQRLLGLLDELRAPAELTFGVPRGRRDDAGPAAGSAVTV
jgi:glycosyltransferase involved in cell wall biosynthesis